jgi:hypothetical protein
MELLQSNSHIKCPYQRFEGDAHYLIKHKGDWKCPFMGCEGYLNYQNLNVNCMENREEEKIKLRGVKSNNHFINNNVGRFILGLVCGISIILMWIIGNLHANKIIPDNFKLFYELVVGLAIGFCLFIIWLIIKKKI